MSRSALAFLSSIILAVLFNYRYLPTPTVNAQTSATTCRGAQAHGRRLQATITEDESAIRRLAAGLAAKDLTDLASAAGEERDRLLKRSLQSGTGVLVDRLLALPENALHLPTI